MMFPAPVAGLVLLLASLVSTVDRYSFDGGVLIYMFEWKWKDIAHECEDFLSHYGYSAVVISPPTENVILPNRPWYERYQPISYKLETRSGTREELEEMVRRCNAVNVRVIADAVLNHMAASHGNCQGTGNSPCDANNFKYEAAGLYWDDFHHFGEITNFQNRFEVRNHELLGLHDIDQSRKHVQDIQVNFLNDLVGLGVAGFRIDAAKHMEPGDLQTILDRLQDLNTQHNFPAKTKPFIFLEVIDNGNEPITFSEYNHLGKVTDFRYGNQLGMHFRKMDGRRLSGLRGFCWPPNWNMLPKDVGVVFVDNHDTQHDVFQPNHIDFRMSSQYKMAVAFMLAYNWGLPMLMSSYSFKEKKEGPPADERGHTRSPSIDGMYCDKGKEKRWVCEQRWRQIFNMVEFHNVAKGSDVWEWWDNSQNAIAFCRVGKGFIAISMETHEVSAKVKTCVPEGVYCDVINGELTDEGTCSGTEVTVGKDGWADIKIPVAIPDKVDSMLAFHIQSKKGYRRQRRGSSNNQQSSPPQHYSSPPPEQNRHGNDNYRQGDMFHSGISQSGENVEITLKINMSRKWLASLLRDTANAHG